MGGIAEVLKSVLVPRQAKTYEVAATERGDEYQNLREGQRGIPAYDWNVSFPLEGPLQEEERLELDSVSRPRASLSINMRFFPSKKPTLCSEKGLLTADGLLGACAEGRIGLGLVDFVLKTSPPKVVDLLQTAEV
jgi:hypothetical protein